MNVAFFLISEYTAKDATTTAEHFHLLHVFQGKTTEKLSMQKGSLCERTFMQLIYYFVDNMNLVYANTNHFTSII